MTATSPILESPLPAPVPIGETSRKRTAERIAELREGGGQDADLTGVVWVNQDLTGIDLSRANLSGANLSGANLAGARLAGANLREAVLSNANLEGAELLGADLSDADLTGCDASGAGLGHATLHRACLAEATLTGATLTMAQLHHADVRAAMLDNTSLRDAYLSHADFSSAILRDADLTSASLNEATFNRADLRGARMCSVQEYTQTHWIDADIREVYFGGAHLLRRHILDENHLHSFRNESRWNEWIYRVWWLTSDCGRSFLRWGMCTLAITVFFAIAYCFVAIDYGDHPTVISPLYFSIVTMTTLGYGDALPASLPAQLVVIAEVTIGYMMLGGALSIFAAKMGRRSD